MKSLIFAATAGILSLGGIALAAPAQQTPPTPPAIGNDAPPPPRGMGPMGPGGRGLERMDANGDDRISRAEYVTAMGQRFERMDSNRDGFIDKAERDAGPGGRGRRGDAPPAD